MRTSFACGFSFMALACGGSTANGPLHASNGPFTVVARPVELRGADMGEATHEIRIKNRLTQANICDIRISRDGTWSDNLLMTKGCLPPSSASIIIPPTAGEWVVKAETNTGATQTLTVQLDDVPVELSFTE